MYIQGTRSLQPYPKFPGLYTMHVVTTYFSLRLNLCPPPHPLSHPGIRQIRLYHLEYYTAFRAQESVRTGCKTLSSSVFIAVVVGVKTGAPEKP